jgi:acyl carrier protein
MNMIFNTILAQSQNLTRWEKNLNIERKHVKIKKPLTEEINMMNEENIKKMVFQALKKIAPEADLERIDPSVRFREQFEFDSIDFLNLITALQKETGIIIAEEDCLKLSTLKGIINYFLNTHQ